MGARTATSPQELQAAPTPLQAQSALAPPGPQPQSITPPVTVPASDQPAENTTPLLDAAIERVAAVTRQEHDSLDAGDPHSETDKDVLRSVASGSHAVSSHTPVLKTPQPILLADKPASLPSIVPRPIGHDDSLDPPVLPTSPQKETPGIPAETPPKPDIDAGAGTLAPTKDTRESSPETQPKTIDLPAADVPEPLAIGKLRLCRKVHGFGSFEPLGPTEVKAGQRLQVYCEVTGMHYEVRKNSFVAQLSSKIEISAAGNGAIQWTRELGPAEDVCGSRRRDFYVNYRVDLPGSLARGSYCLRLTQTDLIANRSISAEIPLEIAP